MVRGEDLLLDSEAARAERGLLARLQSAGLDEEALTFWAQGKLTVADVLGFAAARGVRVGVLLWDGYQAGMHLTNNPQEEPSGSEAVGVEILLDEQQPCDHPSGAITASEMRGGRRSGGVRRRCRSDAA